MIMALAGPLVGKAIENKKTDKKQKLECRTLRSYVVNVYTFEGPLTRPRNRRNQILGKKSPGKYSKNRSQCPVLGHGTPRCQEMSSMRSILIEEQQILMTAKGLRNNEGPSATGPKEES